MHSFAEFTANFFAEFWEICESLGPWLLAGFLLAGLAGQWIPLAFVKRHLSGGGWRSVAKAVLMGVPLPLCSCGVLPVAVALRKAGASKGAVAAFTATTPQTGVESVAASWSLMGLPFTLARIAADLLAGAVSGCLIDRMRAVKMPELGECNACERGEPRRSFGEKLRAGLREGLIDLPAELGPYMILGALVGAALTALFPADALAPYVGDVWAGYVAATLFALPLFVCATGSIPIAYALVSLGFSPGAAIIFLVFGPATNPSTLAVLWKVLGARASAVYLASLIVAAWALAIAFDALGGSLAGGAHIGEGHAHGALEGVFAALMLAVFAVAYVVRGREGCRCHRHKTHHHERL